MDNQLSENKRYNHSSKIIKDGEIDLIALIRFFWTGRKTIIFITSIFLFTGLLIAVFSPVKYVSNTVFLPQSESKGSFGQLGALAGLAGVNLSSMVGEGGGIKPELYPKITGSYPFIHELVNYPLNYSEHKEPISFYQKSLADSIPSFISLIINYTIGLPWTIKDYFTTPPNLGSISGNNHNGLVLLDKKKESIYKSLSACISINVDKKTELVTVSVEMEEPLIAAQLTKKTVELLQEYVISHKTGQVRENLRFMEERFIEKKAEFEKAHKELFEYRDTYRNRVAERVDTHYQELEDAYNLSMGIYKNLAQQVEQARIAVKKETPVFSVIEPAKVPIKKDKPKRMTILLISGFMGVFFGLIYLIGRLIFNGFKEVWA